ncbi:MAG: cytochrome b/b6 domain-containing protein [Gammaproteobacteria bacterium]|nr:cytochrome b/b6 domain-containing protein [Gammaproteobacteria bacterium]
MGLRDTPRRWGAVTQWLHWSVAALILALIAIGWWMRLMPLSLDKITLYYWHKSIGMLVLALVLIRLGWRAGNRPPPLPRDLPRWEAPLAKLTHIALYLLILLMPLSGWLLNSASGIPFRIFWTIPLPPIAPVSAGLEHIFSLLHLASFSALALLLLGHMAAALRHHFLLHNDVLLRMLPRFGHRSRS